MNKYALDSSYKNLLKIMLPIMGSNFIHLLVSFVDAAFAGRINEEHLASVGVGGIFYQFFYMACFGLIIAFRIKFSYFLGANKLKRTTVLFSNTFLLLGVSGIILYIFGKIFSWLVFIKFPSHEHDILIYDYVNLRLLGIFIIIIHLLLKSYFVALGKTWIFIPAGILMIIVNIIFNYLFLFGPLQGTFPNVIALAFASLISETASTILLYVYYRIKNFDRLRIKKSLITYRYLKNLALFGFPLALQYTIAYGGWMLFILMIERAFDAFLVASGILLIQLSEIVEVPIWGLAATSNTVISNVLGQQKIEKVKQALQRALILSVTISGTMYLIVQIFSKVILRLYSEDEKIIEFTSRMFPYLIPALLMHSIGTIYFNGFLAFGKSVKTLIIEVISVFIYVATGYTLIYILKVEFPYIWFTGFFYWFSTWALSKYYFDKELKRIK